MTALTSADVRELFSPFDIKRLESYANNMLDYHVILDLLPTLSALYFSQRFPEDIKLSGVQSSILLALGLQRKPVEDIEVSLDLAVLAVAIFTDWLLARSSQSELQLPVAQSLALFVKTIRKMTKSLQEIQKAAISSTLPNPHGPAAKIFAPSAESFASTVGGERGIVAELKEEGDEVLKALREEQREVIDGLDLKQ